MNIANTKVNMKKTGLFYWPKKGNVETCALKIKYRFEEGSIVLHTIKNIDDCNMDDYDLIIVGGSTVGADHWEKATKNNFWFNFFAKFQQAEMKNKYSLCLGYDSICIRNERC